jgi:ketosteroid isomerase-like protein
MSQENVELVLGLHSAPDVDLAQIFRDDLMWAASVEVMASSFHADFECIATVLGDNAYRGIDGFRAFQPDWLAPWARYRAEVEKTIDLGERIVVLYRIFGWHQGSTQEVKSTAAWIWTVRNGKIAGIRGYAAPAEALKAVGVEE